MKGILLGLLFFANTVSAQISLEKLKLAATKGQKVIDINLLSEDDVIDGLQEALLISAKKSILQAGTKGGFQHNSLIKIFCPD